MIAWRYLRARRREGGISVIAWFSFFGILFSVGTLIVVMAVMVGFRVEFVSRVLGANGHVLVYPPTVEEFADYENLADRIAQVPGVVRAAPIIETQIMATTDDVAAPALVRGVRPGDIKTIPLIASPEQSVGSIDDFQDGAGIAMGMRMANKLGLGVGDKVTLITPMKTNTPLGRTLRKKTYPIVYLFQIGRADIDDLMVSSATPNCCSARRVKRIRLR
jgi:lipoprotein-releasing system permease protein